MWVSGGLIPDAGTLKFGLSTGGKQFARYPERGHFDENG
jgi:hypothetical protein